MSLLDKFQSWDSFIAYHPGLAPLEKYPEKIIHSTGSRASLSEYFKACGVAQAKIGEVCRLYLSTEDQLRDALAVLLKMKVAMTIEQVMDTTHKRYDAAFSHFMQSALLFQGNDKLPLNGGRGVCHALCKMWLKYGHEKPSFPEWANQEKLRVVEKQQNWKAEAQDNSLKKMEPLWNTATSSVSSMRRFQGKADPLPYMKLFNRPGPTRHSTGTMNFTWASFQNPRMFWTECVDGMTHFHSGRNYVTFTWRAKDFAHSVALRENGGVYYFYDPNAGILQFNDPKKMKNWLMDEFPNAKDYSLEGLVVDVYDYTPKGER